MLRKLVREDGDEDEVVDTEHDLENDKGGETRPGGRIRHPFEHH